MTRDDLMGMFGEQTPACGPARDALIAGGDFVIWDGLTPASQHAGVFRRRLRRAEQRGHTFVGLAASVDIFQQAGDELLRAGCIEPVDKSPVFMIFLDSTATAVVACYRMCRPTTPQTPTDDPE